MSIYDLVRRLGRVHVHWNLGDVGEPLCWSRLQYT